jgi:hypothetical protein
LLAKVAQCKIRCSFERPDADSDAKRWKLQDLKDILRTVEVDGVRLTDSLVQAILDMVAANVGRALPEFDEKLLVPENSPPPPDPSWSHLSVSYQILNRVLQKYPPPIHARMPLIRCLLPMIGSPITAERDAVANFLIIATKFDILTIGQLLQLLEGAVDSWNGSTNSMFAIQCGLMTFCTLLKMHGTTPPAIHRFFDHVVLPSVTSERFAFFQGTWAEIVLFMSGKWPEIAYESVSAVVRECSNRLPTKQAACVKVMGSLLPQVRYDFTVVEGIVKRTADAIASPVFRVAMSGLDLVSLPMFVEIVASPSAGASMMLLGRTMRETAKAHWCPEIRVRASATMEMIGRYSSRMRATRDADVGAREEERLRRWMVIATAAKFDDARKQIAAEQAMWRIKAAAGPPPRSDRKSTL